MPDIDIDFCYERRGEVIDYVIEKMCIRDSGGAVRCLAPFSRRTGGDPEPDGGIYPAAQGKAAAELSISRQRVQAAGGIFCG